MAKGNLAACLSKTLEYEGGYVDHPKDPGGATNMGITFAVLRAWRGKPITKADVRAMSRAEAEAIYNGKYWQPARGDDLPKGVDLATFDFGVNSGVSRASKYLQAVLGVAQDGKIGPVTLKAVIVSETGKIIKALCAKRLGFVRSLAIWNTFGKGWSRRIASVEATALGWVLTKSQLEAEAKAAQGKATGQAGGAVATGAGGAVFDQTSGLPIGLVIAAVIIVGAVLVIRAVINGQRAKALKEVANAA